MNIYHSLFQHIGVDEKAGNIYLCLLEQGKLSPTWIAKYTKLHRIEIYRRLPFLLEIWLVKEMLIGKKKWYLPENPQILQELIKKSQENSLIVLEKLQEQYQSLDKRPSVVYEEGAKSITHVFADIVQSLGKWEVFYRISSETSVDKSNSYLPRDYREKRDKKELERYVIMAKKTADNKKPRAEREVAIMPESYEQFDENVQLIVYKDKVAYIDYNSESALTIQNEKLAWFQIKLFKALFKSLKK